MTNKQRKPIRRVSTARQKQLQEYAKLKRAWHERNRYCAVCRQRDILCGPVDPHHSMGRIHGLLLDTRLWIALCRKHHNMVMSDPAWARCHNLLPPVGWYNDINRADEWSKILNGIEIPK